MPGEQAQIDYAKAQAELATAIAQLAESPELETVFWTFPNDRRLTGLGSERRRQGDMGRQALKPAGLRRINAQRPFHLCPCKSNFR